MRRYLVLSVLGVCLLVLAPAATAFAGSSTHYTGKNSQGHKLVFNVDQTASGPKFVPLLTIMTDRCPVTGNAITIGFAFQGFQVPIKNGKFNFVLNNISNRFSWSGTVTPAKGSGAESHDLAAFDNEGGLQDCASGALPWTAQALAPGSANAVAPRTAYVVTVTKAADGSVRFSVTH